MQLPPLNALRAFESAARHKSFSRAADELHVTPSAISHQIKVLEGHLGLKLFHRQTRRIETTADAERYLPSVRNALQEINRATLQLLAGRRENLITLSLAPAFASGWLIPRLYDFHAAYPDIEVRIATSLQLVDFDRDECDLAVRYGGGDWEGLESHLVLAEELVPLCSPKLLKSRSHPKKPADLKRQRLLFSRPKMDDWKHWFFAAGVSCEDIQVGVRLDDTPLALEAAASGMGYAIASRDLAQRELESGRLVIPFDVAMLSGNAYYLVYPVARRKERKISVFRDWMLSQIEV